MDINQLSEIVKKKILEHKFIQEIEVEDKTFLHKGHKSNEKGKFHLKLNIVSEELRLQNKIKSTKFIYKVLDYEIKNYIHSIQILFI